MFSGKPVPQAFEPTEFLRVAYALATEDADEAALRTAVGRAYYALFLIARDKLGVVTTEKVHGEVIGILNRRNRTRIANQLSSLLNLRLAADYQLVPEREYERDWRSNWVRAKQIVEYLRPELEKMPSVLDRTR